MQRTRFQDKVCVVSGAGSGIGKAIALQFASEGAHVLVVDIHPGHGEETVTQIRTNGGDGEFAYCDVGDPAQVMQAVDTAVRKWGRVNVVVNDTAVTVRSVFAFCKYAVPHMPAGSAIVSISSVHADAATVSAVPDAPSNISIEAFTRGMREELAPRRIRIDCVAPGVVDTPKVQETAGKPEEIAAAVCFLAAAEARFLTGTTLVVDGGRLDIL